jgi:hypothetical protein
MISPVLWLLFLLISSRFIQGINPTDEARKKSFEQQFNLSKVRNKGAVGDAVNYLLEQDKIRVEHHNRSVGSSHVNYRTERFAQDRPICQVSFDSVADDTYFAFLGDVEPPYDYNTCSVLYPRYHVAPVCEERERAAGIVQMYQWEWTLLAAKRGHCQMPETSPIQAAQSFLRNKLKAGKPHRPIEPDSHFPHDKPGRVVNILWLGLSFMGEPFFSLLCKYHDSSMLVDGTIDYTKGGGPLKEIPLKPRLDTGAKCSNPCADCFKPELHPPPSSHLISSVKFAKSPQSKTSSSSTSYFAPPEENLICNPRFIVFQSPPTRASGENGKHHPKQDHPQQESSDEEEPITVRICYQYTFNLAKNQQRLYSKLPCEFTWKDVDVIFTIHSLEEFNAFYYKGTGGDVNSLRHVHVVHISGIYEGLMMKGMTSTYAHHGLPPLDVTNMRGKPNDCEKSDVHLRLPGIPDFAAEVSRSAHTSVPVAYSPSSCTPLALQAWLSLMSTGLNIDCKATERCFQHKKKVGVVEVWA